MKITINNKEHNWYISDLDCYTPEFLKEIIIDLAEKSVRFNSQENKLQTDSDSNVIISLKPFKPLI